MVALDDNEEIWVSFKYEKLPNFCYWCGLVSHDEKDCEVWLARKESTNTKPHEYGPWLRAVPFNLGKTSFIVVTGMGDGLGGATKSPNTPTAEKPSETADKPTGVTTARAEPGEKGGADRVQVTEMETFKTKALITPKSRNNSTPLSEEIISNSNLSTCHTNSVDFGTQIQDIDAAIGKYDSCDEHVDHNQAGTSQVSANREKPLTPSLLAHPLITQELAPHVTENSPPPNPANRTLRIWKKLACENIMETEITQGPMASKRNKEEDLEFLPELPTKKL